MSLSIPPTGSQVLDFFGTPLVIEPPTGRLSGDAGLPVVRQFDQRNGLTRANACAPEGPRGPERPWRRGRWWPAPAGPSGGARRPSA